MTEAPKPTKAEVDAFLAEFEGDSRAAVRALLHDLATLAVDRPLTLSHGHVRGRGMRIPGRPGKVADGR